MEEIRIHRQKRVVYVNGIPHRLTEEEYNLMVTLGIMDNRLVTTDVLLDVMCEGRVQIPADRDVLMTKVSRLRKRVGPALQNHRGRGYMLSGNVQFYG